MILPLAALVVDGGAFFFWLTSSGCAIFVSEAVPYNGERQPPAQIAFALCSRRVLAPMDWGTRRIWR